jgi:hypothetical protein
MSEREFAAYLALLGKLLRLNPRQRDEISQELKDHMDDRLKDLLAAGYDRESAVQIALEEFGDVAGLARDFVSISQQQKRRWVMRFATFSIAGSFVAAMLVFSLWPEGRVRLTQATTAQESQFGSAKSTTAAKSDETSMEARNRKAREKLDQFLEADYFQVPLSDFVEDMQMSSGVEILIMKEQLEENGVGLDQPISISLKNVRTSMLLDLVLKPLNLSHGIRDGIVLISSADDESLTYQLRIYDVRDLITSVDKHEGMSGAGNSQRDTTGGGMSTTDARFVVYQGFGEGSSGLGTTGGGSGGLAATGGGLGGEGSSGLAGMAAGDSGAMMGGLGSGQAAGGGGPMMGGGGMSAPGGMGMPSIPLSPIDMLTQVVTTSIAADSWETNGGVGTISGFDGMLVVRQSAQVHDEIDRLLEMLRETKSQRK